MSEPQYSDYGDYPPQTLGLRANVFYRTDPRGLLFHLARYKFVSKMLSGKNTVLEVGCGDAFGSRLVQQTVGRLTVTDFDPEFIKDIIARQDKAWPLDVYMHDILIGAVEPCGGGKFDAAYALDVIEHIKSEDEMLFITNLCASLVGEGVLIIGTPSKESQIHASEGSKQGHVNTKSGEQLRSLMQQYFVNVFLFSMSDEVVHTGFSKMAHYLFAMGVGKKEISNRRYAKKISATR